ncbi:hypothetical protein GCM10007160_18480 [Litchfieldella qijiaojingensis]|uniref:Uncharacterized protein n=1 Tax=Litchfieldella qijiaojingensis TaxID=980347 RepID=A0ABQ2YSS7_9GAMM|nr:hypothetical protein GCM10007160_18480 [Halomonas qijiaojingensis]
MKFQKTLDIWAIDREEIAKKLQPGQWVTAGGARGVYCGVKPGGTVVVMWEGNAKGRGPRGYSWYRRMLMAYAKGEGLR